MRLIAFKIIEPIHKFSTDLGGELDTQMVLRLLVIAIICQFYKPQSVGIESEWVLLFH